MTENKDIESKVNKFPKQEEVGFAVILMEAIGPQTVFNLSKLNEIDSMYLAVKGFTAFMTGFERTEIGPGKIKGILQIPNTELFVVAFDHNMRGLGTEEDSRMQVSRMAIICLIVSEEGLRTIRSYYYETELFLTDEMKIIESVADLNESFIQKLKIDYNKFLLQLNLEKKIETKKETEEKTLFDVGLLLTLPRDENLTARAIIELMSKNNKEDIHIKDICKITKRKERDEVKILEKLIAKGLIIISASQSTKELIFIAK